MRIVWKIGNSKKVTCCKNSTKYLIVAFIYCKALAGLTILYIKVGYEHEEKVLKVIDINILIFVVANCHITQLLLVPAESV